MNYPAAELRGIYIFTLPHCLAASPLLGETRRNKKGYKSEFEPKYKFHITTPELNSEEFFSLKKYDFYFY